MDDEILGGKTVSERTGMPTAAEACLRCPACGAEVERDKR